MKKVIAITAAVLASFTVVTSASASAANISELGYQIAFCQKIKDVCHQMAECARFLGYGDDHVIIQTSKQRWTEAATQESMLTASLKAILDGEDPGCPK